MNAKELGPCPICGRPMQEGPAVDRHHWIPRSKGGREDAHEWSWLHRICHKKLHSLFDERTLAREFSDPASLRSNPDIEVFVKWIRKKPADYIGRHDRPRARR